MTVQAPPLSDEERRCCEEIISDFANTDMPSYSLARAATVAHALERLTTSLERCREALKRIAEQKTSAELEDEDADPECLDFEGGYNDIVKTAREALNPYSRLSGSPPSTPRDTD